MRILLILGPFLLAIGGLVYLQTAAFEAQGMSIWNTKQAQVSEPEIQLTNVTDVVARLPEQTPASLEQAVQAAIVETAPQNGEMKSLTSSVLQGLGVSPAPPAAEPENELRALTHSVLANLSGHTSDTSPEQIAGPQTLANLVTMAVQEGMSDNFIDAMVNAAAESDDIVVPAAYLTSEGRVDTRSIITELARAASGETAQATPNALLIGGPGVEVRVVQEAGQSVQHNFYTVQVGDSLGAISQLFYGDAALYTKIYEANRRLLSSPNRIRAGQRLSIPAFSAT